MRHNAPSSQLKQHCAPFFWPFFFSLKSHLHDNQIKYKRQTTENLIHTFILFNIRQAGMIETTSDDKDEKNKKIRHQIESEMKMNRHVRKKAAGIGVRIWNSHANSWILFI